MTSEGAPLETSLREILASAVSLHSAGRVVEAERLYLTAHARDPRNSDVLHLLGVAAYQLGRLEEAEERIRNAIEIEPADPSYRSNLGNVLGARGALEEAVASYRAALRLAPDFLDARNNLGAALKKLGRAEEAVAELREVIQRLPRSARAHNNLGAALRSLGRPEEAAASFRRAIELDPDYGDAHHNLGNVLLQMDRAEEAIRAFEAALAVAGASAPATGPDGARGESRDERSPRPDPERASDPIRAAETRFRLALALARVDRAEDAIACCRIAVSLRPRDAALRNGLGSLLQRSGRSEEAIACYDEAIRLDPRSAEALYNRATVHQSIGRVHTAVQGYREALTIDPLFTPAHRALGRLLYGIGDTAGALEAYQRWRAIDPGDPEARHLEAAAGGGEVPDRASPDYVRRHFDAFAQDFDRQLLGLGYCGPELVMESLRPHLPVPPGLWDVLDAGCGTGLSGLPLRSISRRLTGVDLSEEMIRAARQRGVYDELERADLESFLERHPDAFDLVVAADTLVYFGNVERLFALVARSLREGGLFVSTAEVPPGEPPTESEGPARAPRSGSGRNTDGSGRLADRPSSEDPGFVLHPGGRYAHARPYLQRTLRAVGLETLAVRRSFLRSERDQRVDAWVVLARKPFGTA